eukprot:3170159-Pyramimonas_sp.AAC.1
MAKHERFAFHLRMAGPTWSTQWLFGLTSAAPRAALTAQRCRSTRGPRWPANSTAHGDVNQSI